MRFRINLLKAAQYSHQNQCQVGILVKSKIFLQLVTLDLRRADLKQLTQLDLKFLISFLSIYLKFAEEKFNFCVRNRPIIRLGLKERQTTGFWISLILKELLKLCEHFLSLLSVLICTLDCKVENLISHKDYKLKLSN